MIIGGLQKSSFIDFPQHISAIIFTQGCNFTCPYCHNASLLSNENNIYRTVDEVIEFLIKRKQVLQGVVITGGEPTLQADLLDFCKEVKSIGYRIKLDTNGSNPTILQHILDENMLDYVAMDIKANPKNYPQEIWKKRKESVAESIKILEKSAILHEFRIPCVFPFITKKSFSKILSHVHEAPIYLQKVQIKEVLTPVFFVKNGYALDENNIKELLAIAKSQNKNCMIRE